MEFSFPIEFISEGSVRIAVPKLQDFISAPSDYAPSKAPVFFNPVMELNRDFAVLVLRAFQLDLNRDLRVCEPLGGCGIRSVRLAREVDGVKEIVVNDINREAYRLAKYNIEKNFLTGKSVVKNEDANFLLGNFGVPRKRFDYIDVDPFGSPMSFLNSALRAVRNKGLLALTATDLAPLCGVHPKACIRKYGGKPLRTEYCHELAVRLLAGALARSAARYDIGTTMVFSHSSEHYIRLYSKVDYGAKKANASLDNIGYVLHCFACFHREASIGMFYCAKESCPECGEKMAISGPLWLGKLVSENFITTMEREAKIKDFRHGRKIRKLLSLIRDETNAPITYYRVDAFCDKIGLPMPQLNKLIEELRNAGKSASLTHFHAQGIKTNASAKVVQNIISNNQ